MSFCAATKKKTGAPCGGRCVEGSRFCAFHDPERAQAVAAGRKAGGKEIQRRAAGPDESVLPMGLETPSDVVAIARDAVNHVRSGHLTPKQGTAIGSLLSAALQGMKAEKERAQDTGGKGERPLSTESKDSLKAALNALQQTAQH